MTPLEMRGQLEEELTWRREEVAFFQNIGARVDEGDRDRYRRSLVLMLYAHFEGFCKFALLTYINAVNQEQVSCFRATPVLVSAALSDALKALKNSQSKSDFFRRTAPDDQKLHSLARDIEFIERARAVMRVKVEIPDSAVDTESNLKPIVLKKNLFRLGLDIDRLDSHSQFIEKLLGMRNKISHGASRTGVTPPQYGEVKDAAFRVMDGVMHAVYQSFLDKKYLRHAPMPAVLPPAEVSL